MLLLFLLKPLLYVGAFALAARKLRAYGPHWRLPEWALVTSAAALRLAAGFVIYWLSWKLAETYGPLNPISQMPEEPPIQVTLALGLLLWWLAARVTFRRAPALSLVIFALAAAGMSGTIDYLAWSELQHLNMC